MAMVYVDLSQADDLLQDCHGYTPDNIRRAQASIGRTATLSGPFPIRVTLVEWRPAYGKSRWLVRADDGAQAVVSASRLSAARPT